MTATQGRFQIFLYVDGIILSIVVISSDCGNVTLLTSQVFISKCFMVHVHNIYDIYIYTHTQGPAQILPLFIIKS